MKAKILFLLFISILFSSKITYGQTGGKKN
jgi:hypothetical protein